jgi:hypothetical protein
MRLRRAALGLQQALAATIFVRIGLHPSAVSSCSL